tara:strand:- start:29866 stop:30390 length:525 start_codon:yes stop_codon:yes gene_type:complete
MGTLTPKQQAFVDEYLKDLNATQAYIRAGYSGVGKTAEVNACRLLSNAKVSAAVQIAKEQRSKRTQVDSDSLLSHLDAESNADLADLYDEDTGALKPVHKWPLIWRQGLVSGVDVNELTVEGQSIGQVVKVKLADRTRIRELIGKHINVGAFQENLAHKVLEAPVIVINRPSGD